MRPDLEKSWIKMNNRETAITEIKLADLGKFFRAWDPWFQALAEAYLEVARKINAMFPNGVEAALVHRAEVKRVRTQYRRRQMARKRRKR